MAVYMVKISAFYSIISFYRFVQVIRVLSRTGVLKELESICHFNFNVTSVNEHTDNVVVEGISNGAIVSQKFDQVIDCTYNHLGMTSSQEFFYEPCILLKYK
jgi:hypothetical protein